jgi:putative selenium metabolism hydrolase
MLGAMRDPVELCQALVRVESLPGREGAVADLVEAAARDLGFDHVVRDELGTVIAVKQGARSGKTTVFDAHMDVVPATEPERWTRPPFSGIRAEGRVWGRGATDVKGSLAALLVAVGDLSASDLGGRVVVSASIAEERMEGVALGRVLDLWPADRVVICEPTLLRVGLGHKGRASLVVEAEGRAAHTSHPERGVNAVARMIAAAPGLIGLELPSDPLLGPGVMSLVEISSEPFPASSMVPFRCRARFDRRLVRSETRQGVLAELQAVVRGQQGVSVRYHRTELVTYTGVRLEEEVFHPCWVVPPDGELARRAEEALREVGQEGSFHHAPYCTNGACSAGERGIPTIVYGAGSIEDAHVVDEGVDVDQVLGAFEGYRALARRLGQQ